MKQKLLLYFLITLSSMVGLKGYSYDFSEDSNGHTIYYNLINNNQAAQVTYKSTPHNSYSGFVYIPSTVYYKGEYLPVTSIGDQAFQDCSGLTSVTIPSSVTSIDDRAFYNCSGLTSVTIPEGVTSIGNDAFSGCSGLTSVTINSNAIMSKEYTHFSNIGSIFGSQVKEYIIGEGVTRIVSYAFSGCSGLTSVTIGKGVTSISFAAFRYCSGLTSVTIPDGVTSIGYQAFQDCSGLTSVTIGEGVTSINDAFSGCSGLTSVTINSNAIMSKEYTSSSNIGNIFGSQVTEYIIGDGVTSIGSYAFSSCSGLTSVTIPKGVTSIGDYTFYNCSGLMSVTIPEGVTSIGDYTFYNCSGLTSVTIPEGVTSIGDYTFNNCSGLTSVTIGKGVTSIGENAFKYCSGLTSVTIPSSVTSIGSDAFKYCSGLTKVIVPDIAAWCGISFGNSYANPLRYSHHLYSDENTEITNLVIPEGVTNIRFAAFYNCSSLTSVAIPDGVTSIGKSAFCYCSGLTSVTIPSSVTSIGDYAFYNCSGLTGVTVPKASIGESAFTGCNQITDLNLNCETIENWFADSKTTVKVLTLGEGTTTISDSAFEGFSALTTISLGSNVSNIGANTFANLPKLEDVYCHAVRYPHVDASTFQGSYVEYVTLHVPEVSLQQYKDHDVWGKFFKIVPLDETSAISDIDREGSTSEIEAIYDQNGQRLPALRRGINIIKMSDGSIKKVLVK